MLHDLFIPELFGLALFSFRMSHGLCILKLCASLKCRQGLYLEVFTFCCFYVLWIKQEIYAACGRYGCIEMISDQEKRR